MSRHIHRINISEEIRDVRRALQGVQASDRLHVIAEALMDLNLEGAEYQSCGCGDWDITMDYRKEGDRK